MHLDDDRERRAARANRVARALERVDLRTLDVHADERRSNVQQATEVVNRDDPHPAPVRRRRRVRGLGQAVDVRQRILVQHRVAARVRDGGFDEAYTVGQPVERDMPPCRVRAGGGGFDRDHAARPSGPERLEDRIHAQKGADVRDDGARMDRLPEKVVQRRLAVVRHEVTDGRIDPDRCAVDPPRQSTTTVHRTKPGGIDPSRQVQRRRRERGRHETFCTTAAPMRRSVFAQAAASCWRGHVRRGRPCSVAIVVPHRS